MSEGAKTLNQTIDTHHIYMSVISQYLRQFTEVTIIDVSSDAVVRLLHILANKVESIGRRQQREQLVLLGLIVQDLGLWCSKGETDVQV